MLITRKAFCLQFSAFTFPFAFYLLPFTFRLSPFLKINLKCFTATIVSIFKHNKIDSRRNARRQKQTHHTNDNCVW
jgi:hypothetical protein